MAKVSEAFLGSIFGRLTVTAYSPSVNGSGKFAKCVCTCGVEKLIPVAWLGRNTNSCGCLASETVKSTPVTHGMRYTRVYEIWSGLLKRCLNSSSKTFEFYGGRGIEVCERWKSFENFYADMGNPPTDAHTIERKDVNGNYELENCVWASKLEQARNKRNNVKVLLNGKTYALSEACEIVGIGYKKVHARLAKCKWPIEKALSVDAKWPDKNPYNPT